MKNSISNSVPEPGGQRKLATLNFKWTQMIHVPFAKTNAICAISFLLIVDVLIGQQATTCDVRLDESVADQPVTGRLLVFFSKRNPNPINGPNWFGPEPFFGKNMVGWQPGDTIQVNDSADHMDSPISELPHGEYYVQAILDHDFYCSDHAKGPGNFFSQARKVVVDGSSNRV